MLYLSCNSKHESDIIMIFPISRASDLSGERPKGRGT